MKVLVTGSGGREHALAWKLKQSLKVSKIFIAPGNPGTATCGENIDARTSKEVLDWLKKNPVNLVVIGPDNHLAEGLADSVQELGIPVFGPTKSSAEIEWSKSYAKQFMREEGIPTARYEVFTDSKRAQEYIRTQALPIVIKADGLAAGKGVIIAKTLAEADAALHEILNEKIFGESGQQIVVEEYLSGFEISAHAFCDGENARMFPISKDHKRIFDNDQGPNTGGMGTIAPVPNVSPEDIELIRTQIVMPTLVGLKKRGRPFRGVLYPGVMLTKDGPRVIEFNARFGDPETQSYMRILESDLYEILYACASRSLTGIEVGWADTSACCIIVASEGYPSTYKKGVPITVPADTSDVVVFHAGTAIQGGQVVSAGGRILGITAVGLSLKQALAAAYAVLSSEICMEAQYRKDIGASSIVS